MLKFSLIYLLASYASLTTSAPTENEGLSLIKTGEDIPAKWMSKSEVWNLVQNGTKFIDITGHTFPEKDQKVWEPTAFPTDPRHEDSVRPLLNAVNQERMKKFISVFSSFHNRYFESCFGLKSEKWLLGQVTSAANHYEMGNIEVKEFEHMWLQPSTIARIEGQDDELKAEVVIIGAHQDSININSTRKRAPGADDNGSGSAVVLEIFRILTQAQFRPKRSLEFHWYSGEEMGLKGSGDVAEEYHKQDKKVLAMLNLDVSGYVGNSTDKRVAIVTDFTDPELNAFLRRMIETYSEWDWKDSTCGYGCSDHASWTNYKYKASYTDATEFNPYMHTVEDTMEKISWDQMLEITKVGLAAVVELAEPETCGT